MSQPEIWDLHCHLSGVPGTTPEERLGKLLAFADRMGIARLCVSMGLELSQDPSPEEMRLENDAILRAIRRENAQRLVSAGPKHSLNVLAAGVA